MVFEDVFLVRSCLQAAREVRDLALQQARLEATNALLRSSAERLTEGAGALASATYQQRDRVGRQSAALQQAQVTMQALQQTGHSAAGRAQAVVAGAERAEQVGRAGQAALTHSAGALEAVRAQTGEIAARIASLEEHTRRINGIAETVGELADQSNLLAVNAAIEAARSGEAELSARSGEALQHFVDSLQGALARRPAG